jgi:hypothetical protein
MDKITPLITTLKSVIAEKRMCFTRNLPADLLPHIASFVADTSSLSRAFLDVDNSCDLLPLTRVCRRWRQEIFPLVTSVTTCLYKRGSDGVVKVLPFKFYNNIELGNCLDETTVVSILSTVQDTEGDRRIGLILGSSLETINNVSGALKLLECQTGTVSLTIKKWSEPVSNKPETENCSLSFPFTDILHIDNYLSNNQMKANQRFYTHLFDNIDSPRVVVYAHRSTLVPTICFYASDIHGITKWTNDITDSLQWSHWKNILLKPGNRFCFVVPVVNANGQMQYLDRESMITKKKNEIKSRVEGVIQKLISNSKRKTRAESNSRIINSISGSISTPRVEFVDSSDVFMSWTQNYAVVGFSINMDIQTPESPINKSI